VGDNSQCDSASLCRASRPVGLDEFLHHDTGADVAASVRALVVNCDLLTRAQNEVKIPRRDTFWRVLGRADANFLKHL
jgi:hypothetical protein